MEFLEVFVEEVLEMYMNWFRNAKNKKKNFNHMIEIYEGLKVSTLHPTGTGYGIFRPNMVKSNC